MGFSRCLWRDRGVQESHIRCMDLKSEQLASVYTLNCNPENGLPSGALSMPGDLSDTGDRPLSVEGMLVIVVSNLSKNTRINSSSRSQFGKEIHLSLGREKKNLKKRKKREREKIYCLDIPGVAFFPSFFFPLSLKDLPSYEFESLRTCLHREIYRPNYASIIRLINLPVYTSLNFKSSIVSECKPSKQLYFRPLNYACQLWADCRSL